MLKGQVALVTGAARGIGRAIAIELAHAGADVALLDIAAPVPEATSYPMATPAELDEASRLAGEAGRRALSLRADVRSTDAVNSAVERTLRELGRIDILIANAGFTVYNRPITQVSDALWDAVIGVNLTGAAKCMRAVIPHMTERGSGRIVAIASVAGQIGTPGQAYYGASKWGMIGLAKAVAGEVAERGITVNAVCPGAVDTAMAHNPDAYQAFGGSREAGEAGLRRGLTAGNVIKVPWAEPEDIAAAVLYLVGPRGRLVTGSTVNVDCGLSVRNSA
jgi:NAD(P)-dependent dehydrogenase (short-subunit alcohol dehydrogenase family)